MCWHLAFRIFMLVLEGIKLMQLKCSFGQKSDQKSRFDRFCRLSPMSGVGVTIQPNSCRQMGQRLVCILVLIVGALSSSVAFSDNRTVAIESLSPTLEHRVETERIVQLMQRYHYKPVPVDDELSEQIFDRYLETLDPEKSFFLASDIEEFSQFRFELDDVLRDVKLNPVFDIFKRFRQRMDEQAMVAQGLLKRKFDFTIDENYTFDREDAQWPQSQKSMDELWRKRVKNDILNLRLADQSNDELIETLEKRYKRMATRVSQYGANDVFQFFINAYTQSVEPHTSYFSPRSSENFNINMSLSLEGIGTALQTENEYTVIRRIIAGGPAALSEQVSVDDRIVGVGNGEDEEIVDIVSWPLDEVVDLIRGPKGSTVRLKILPVSAPAGSPPKIITLVRDKIKLEEQAAKSSVVEVTNNEQMKRIGVIDLPTFYLDSAAQAEGQSDYRSTTRDVQRLLTELTASDNAVDGVIIDLRGNGGGSLVEATQMTGLFIKDGPVVQIREASGQVSAQEDDDPTVAYDGPLAVLVDRNSASASEIFAAAIQDYGRGVVLGEPTFGKGTVQSVVPLDQEGKLGQLKITIAQFFRVNGEGTQHRGVVPDVLFPTSVDSVAQGERGLDNALEWAEVSADKYDKWSANKPDFKQLQAQHESRYRANDWFDLLVEELEVQRTDRAQQHISLVETIREEKNVARGSDREERLQLYRKAFGASGSDTDNENDEAEIPDIILDEAANVLIDATNELR